MKLFYRYSPAPSLIIIIIIIIAISSSSNATTTKAQKEGKQHRRYRRNLVPLNERWNIGEPIFTQDGLDFTFDFPLSNFIDQGQAYYEVYDSGCRELVTTGFILNPLVDVDVGSVMDDDSFQIDGKLATIPVGIDVDTVTGNPDVYTETDEGASVVFCVRFGLNTLNDQPIEVNFLESIITVNIDLTSGFSVAGISVTPADQVVTTSSQGYNVEGYMCEEGSDTPVVDASAAMSQGALITICIKPDDDARNDNVKMRTIDSFVWTRDSTIQTAIELGVASDNLLTSFDATMCTGSDYCQFSSVLFAGFYVTNGQVSGNGVASMQFGTTAGSVGRRNLSKEKEQDGDGLFLDRQRTLQQQEDATSTSEFDISLSIARVYDGPDPLFLQTLASAGASFDLVFASVSTTAMIGTAVALFLY